MFLRKDRIFSDPDSANRPFRFSSKVVSVFDNMVLRSIPLYREVQRLSAFLAVRHWQPGTWLYDLGCSTGQSLVYLNREYRRSRPGERLKYYGLDRSSKMCHKAKKRLKRYHQTVNGNIHTEDLLDSRIDNASVVLCQYTFHFLQNEEKATVMGNIFQGMTSGGMLILTDKTEPEYPENIPLFLEAYDRFKRDNGYSYDEISRKRKALNGVLVPLKCQDQIAMMRQVGFIRCEAVLKWFPFVTYIAFKPGDV